MHFNNGRTAKSGDRVVNLVTGQTGVIYDPNPSTPTCNARLSPTTPNDPWINLRDCVHIDDVRAAAITDTSVAVLPDPPDTFSIGTVVWLKSGSPPLTITGVAPDSTANVEWVQNDGVTNQANYPLESLTLTETTPSPAEVVAPAVSAGAGGVPTDGTLVDGAGGAPE